MYAFERMRDFARAFAQKARASLRDERGTTATMLGFAMIPLMAISGAAVDYSTVARTRSILQESLDAAVLAGASSVAQGANSEGDGVSKAVKAYIDANFGKTQNLNPTTKVQVTKDGTVLATVTLDVPLHVMPVLERFPIM